MHDLLGPSVIFLSLSSTKTPCQMSAVMPLVWFPRSLRCRHGKAGGFHNECVCVRVSLMSTLALFSHRIISNTTQNCDYRFLISDAHPSIPSPFMPTGVGSFTPFMPLVPSKKGLLLIPPAFALSCGSRPSMGIRKSAIRSASSRVK